MKFLLKKPLVLQKKKFKQNKTAKTIGSLAWFLPRIVSLSPIIQTDSPVWKNFDKTAEISLDVGGINHFIYELI